MANAVVLKTTARKGLQVRVLFSPPSFYKKEKAADAKVIQVLLADAEKDRKEAEFIIQQNRKLESKQIIKDNRPDNNIKLTAKRREQENE